MPAPRFRCAIYTRKSSDEGLEQGFNSLHAQREACEAYVLSQAGEGWKALATVYDDGGFSGGSMERPGLKALLNDIDRGLIDVVVVYKVDRLTRSLGDFARIVEAFDAKSVSFVSVTQAFNTTSSMGRLTLNVLLSFAQFEREVTGERIRDKIAASKAKGLWMGGVPPLGYDPPADPNHRALRVNPSEAETVRLIFARYLELGSVHLLARWLEAQPIRSKAWTTRKGRAMGGQTFNRGALFHLLKNRTYLGQIVHKERSHPGLQPAIVDPEVFDAVQVRLASHIVRPRARSGRTPMMLKGLIFDADGHPMSPTAGKGAKGYRYYVSSPLLKGSGDLHRDTPRRAPAPLIEAQVSEALARLANLGAAIGVKEADGLIERVEMHHTTLQLIVRRAQLFKRGSDPDHEFETLQARLRANERLSREPGDQSCVRLILPCRLRRHGGRVTIIGGDRGQVGKSSPDPVLIKTLRHVHTALAEETGGPLGRVEQMVLNEVPANRYQRLLYRLAFLAPDIQTRILEGLQSSALTLGAVLQGDLPVSWEDQRKVFETPCRPFSR